MTTLYRRTVALEIGEPGQSARRIDGLRITFKARRTSTSAPDPAEVTLYNPADATLGALTSPTVVTRIMAGYGDDAQQVAAGTVVRRSLVVTRDGPDRIARWQVQDGGYELRSVFVNRAWQGVTQAADVIEFVRQQAGWARGSQVLRVQQVYRRGFVAYGSARSVLDEVVRDCGSRWSVVDGRLTVWRDDDARRTTLDVLSADSGLIGAPRRTDDGAEFVALLRPGMRQGDRFQVDHRGFAGTWQAIDVTHAGDSGWSSEFYTTIHARAA